VSSEKAQSKVMLVSADLQAASAPGAMALEPLAESRDEFEAGKLRVAYGEDAETPAPDYDGQKLTTRHLYTLESSTGGDTLSTRFGVREFRFDTATKRAYLNGKVY
jgi:hypothetical protein